MTYHLLVVFHLFEFLTHLSDLCFLVLARFIRISKSVLNPLDFELMLGILLHQSFLFFHILSQKVLGI